MYKSEFADHPWRDLRDKAGFRRAYRNVGRDIKIGQLWILLVIMIMIGTAVAGVFVSTSLDTLPLDKLSLPVQYSKVVAQISYPRSLIICAFLIIQCLFVLVGNKYMVRLLTWQLVPLAVLALTGAAYLLFTPEMQPLGILVLIGFSPYILCAGILTLSWRAKLYLSYMGGEF